MQNGRLTTIQSKVTINARSSEALVDGHSETLWLGFLTSSNLLRRELSLAYRRALVSNQNLKEEQWREYGCCGFCLVSR